MEASNLALYSLIKNNQKSFAAAVIEAGRVLNCDPNWLMYVMYFESKLNPAAKNPYSSATGLIQFTSATALSLGTSTGALREMSNVEQMRYVVKYLMPYKKYLNSLTNVYLAVFYPAGLSKDESWFLPLSESWVNANKIFDVNGDKRIQKSEITSYIKNYFEKLQKKLGIPIIPAAGGGLLAIAALVFFCSII